MFDLRPPRARRRPSLTPMIDVVFLLLVFFMLASRFGVEHDQALTSAGAGSYSGPPRLVQVGPDALWLNGQPVALAALPGALRKLMAGPGEAVVVQPRNGADMQRLVTVVSALRSAGLSHVALVP